MSTEFAAISVIGRSSQIAGNSWANGCCSPPALSLWAWVLLYLRFAVNASRTACSCRALGRPGILPLRSQGVPLQDRQPRRGYDSVLVSRSVQHLARPIRPAAEPPSLIAIFSPRVDRNEKPVLSKESAKPISLAFWHDQPSASISTADECGVDARTCVRRDGSDRRKPSSALPNWSSGYMPTGLAGRAPERVRRHRTNSSGPQAIDTAGKSTT
jgi:hypothetical protein